VKKVAKEAGAPGRFASQSLRIGGATAGVAGGLDYAEITAIGNWKSASAIRYMRARAAAERGASRRMGLC
jgi:hypothetical protein